jgi:protein-S-isoprenylcysteine O-methyltransferase Ste14
MMAQLYSALCYLVLSASLLYAIGFIGNIGVPRSVDSGLSGALMRSLLIDLGLLVLVLIPHVVMARPWFRQLWTRGIADPLQRPTKVLLFSLFMLLLFGQWHSVSQVVWSVESASVRAVLSTLFFLSALGALVASVLLIRRLHLLSASPRFPEMHPARTRSIRLIIGLSFMTALLATPQMTAGHLLFSLAASISIFVTLRIMRISSSPSDAEFDSGTAQRASLFVS